MILTKITMPCDKRTSFSNNNIGLIYVIKPGINPPERCTEGPFQSLLQRLHIVNKIDLWSPSTIRKSVQAFDFPAATVPTPISRLLPKVKANRTGPGTVVALPKRRQLLCTNTAKVLGCNIQMVDNFTGQLDLFCQVCQAST